MKRIVKLVVQVVSLNGHHFVGLVDPDVGPQLTDRVSDFLPTRKAAEAELACWPDPYWI